VCRSLVSKSFGAVFLELRVECVPVTDSGDVVAFAVSVEIRSAYHDSDRIAVADVSFTYRTTSRIR
jgi:hypothetical protein